MSTLRHSAVLVLALAVSLSGCGRTDTKPAVDSTPIDTTLSTDTSAAAVDLRGWTDDAGPALYVADESGERAIVVLPQMSDSMLADTLFAAQMPVELGAVAGTSLDLFARPGRIGSGTVAAADEASLPDGGGCVAWPTLALVTTSGAPWTIAFASGRAVAIPLDSVDMLSGADSARMTAEVSRLASLVPNDTVPAFRGLPFAVRSVRRFSPAPGIPALVAEVARKVNQEANPREERILIVAERDSGKASGRYSVAYAERTSGTEEDVETTDILSAVMVGPARTPTLVLRREYFEGSAYALLERVGPRSWRVRWTSAYAGC